MAPANKQASGRTGRGAPKKIGGVDVPGDANLECDRYPPSKLFPVSGLIDSFFPEGIFRRDLQRY